MGKFTTANQRGFTLIEMSIVLVIIGLIVGGILKGQELIESARQKNAISQIDTIKSSVTTFIDRFKSYPGDFGRATTVLNSILANGDDSGTVGTTRADATAMRTLLDATGNGETVQFWNHLLASNAVGGATLIDSAVNPSAFSGGGATPSPLPASAYPQSGLSITYGTHEGTTVTSGTSKVGHWLIMHRWAGNGTLSTEAVISPERAYQMDSKYDDGLPGSGQIRSIYLGTGCGAVGTNSWTATSTTTACIPVFFLE